MNYKTRQSQWVFLLFLALILTFIIALIAYNFGYYNAVASENPVDQVTKDTTTVDIALDPLVQALRGNTSSPLTLNVVITSPKQQASAEDSDDKLRFALFTGGLTLAASLLTAALGYMYSYYSNRQSRQFDWAKFVWEKYQSEYIEFARVLSSTLNPDILQTKLDALKEKAFIPMSIQSKIESYISELEMQQDNQEKEALKTAMCSVFDAFRMHPWEHF